MTVRQVQRALRVLERGGLAYQLDDHWFITPAGEALLAEIDAVHARRQQHQRTVHNWTSRRAAARFGT